MEMNLQKFILEHESDDPDMLILQRDRYPDLDIATAARCIHGRKTARLKIPSWYNTTSLLYPSNVSMEQCSSEASAKYKQRFVGKGSRIADLTGGFGVDTYFLSLVAGSTDYFERNQELAGTATHNFNELRAANISVFNREIDSAALQQIPDDFYDLIYIDPARRGKYGERVYSIHDCEPDIMEIKSELLRIAPEILVKISPMADISAVASELKETAEIHVVAVNNECKEVLLLLSRENKEHTITAIELSTGKWFSYTPVEERNAAVQYAGQSDLQPGSFLYIPSAAVLKAGPFKLLSSRMHVSKLAPSSHYYVSPSYIRNFPGKIRKIEAVYQFNRSFIRDFGKRFPECSVSSRNFPLSAAELKKRMKLRESSHYHLIATTDNSGGKIAILSVPV